MVLVAGGQDDGSTEILYADSNAFKEIYPLKVVRKSGRMGVLPGNRIVITGGISPGRV